MLTNPKLMLPFQIARITKVISHLQEELRVPFALSDQVMAGGAPALQQMSTGRNREGRAACLPRRSHT